MGEWEGKLAGYLPKLFLQCPLTRFIFDLITADNISPENQELHGPPLYQSTGVYFLGPEELI